MVVYNSKAQQHTLFNCYDEHSYGPKPDSRQLEYLETLRQFERLFGKYRAANKDVFVKLKT
jgi:hypothetical protein